MGIFSSSYETYVATYISSFSDSGKFVSSKEKGIISGIARNEDMGEHVLENLVSGPAFRAKKAYKFAGEPFMENGVSTEYVFGRPNDTLFAKTGSTGALKTALTSYLQSVYGSSITVTYTYFGVYNYYHKTFEHLKSISYNFNTGEIASLTESQGYKILLYSADLLVPVSLVDQVLTSFDPLLTQSGSILVVDTDENTSTIILTLTYRGVKTTITSRDHSQDFSSSTSTSTYTGTSTESYSTTSTSSTTYPYTFTTTYQTVPTVAGTFYQNTDVTDVFVGVMTETTTTVDSYNGGTKIGTITVTTQYHVDGTMTSTKKEYKQGTVSVDPFNLSALEKEETYLLAFFHSPSVSGFPFSYRMGSGTVSLLENIFESSYSFPGTYMPRCYLRWEFLNGNDSTVLNTTKYTHSKRLAKKMGFKYDKIIKKAFAYDTPTTPDNEKVGRTAEELALLRSSFITYLVRARSEDPIEVKYLYNHFNKWYNNLGGGTTTDEWEAFKDSLVRDDFDEAVLVIEDKRFKSTIGLQGIWKYEGTGTFHINKAGVYDRQSKKGEYGTKSGKFSIAESRQAGSKGHTFTQIFNYNWNLYRFQKKDSTDVGGAKYDEVRVIGLETKYYVTGDHFAMSGFVDQSEETKDILYVPVDYDIVKSFTLFEEEELMYKSLHFVANQSQTIKLEWYQSSFWEFVFTAAAFVAAAFGYVEGFEFVAAITAIAGASMVWAMEILLATLIDLLASAIAAYVFVRVAGEDLAMLAAMVMVAYGMGNSFGLKLPYASELLSYSNSIFKAVNKEIVGTINSLKSEYEDLLKESSSVIKDLQDSIDEASPKISELTKELIREIPEEFLNKSHIGNIGTKVFDIQRNYVDISLRLPYRPTYSEV